MKRRNLGLAVLAATLAPTGSALATGFLTARFGGEHGSPTTDNATAMYYNPAGLALGSGTRVFIDGTVAWVKATFDRDPASVYPVIPAGQTKCPTTGTPSCLGTLADNIGQNSGKATLFNVAAAPFLGVVSDFGVPNLGVGLGFYVPFGGASVWDSKSKYKSDKLAPGAFDGAQRWWSIEGTLRSLYFTAAGAYTIPEARLSFGLSLNLVVSEIQTIRARNVSGMDEMVSQDAAGRIKVEEGRSRIDVKGTNLSMGAGVIWKPTDDLFLGLSYQSQPGFGKMKLKGDLDLSYDAGPVETSKIRLEEELPDIIRLGGRWRVNPQWEARLSGEFDRWSVFNRQCLVVDGAKDGACALDSKGDPKPGVDSSVIVQNLKRDWQNAFAVRGGASYFLSDWVELFGGVGFDGNAVPDKTIDPALPDFNDLSAGVGTKLKLLADNSLALATSYTQIFYISRDIKPRADKDGNGVPDSGLNSPTSLQPDAAGKYERAIGVFNLNVEYTF